MVELQKKNAPEEEVACKTMLEEFMSESYEFRHNILSDKYEMRNIGEEWRPVTLKSINSISLRLKREIAESKRWKSAVEEYIQSEETPTYDPISNYLNNLPAWDGKDRTREFFDRLPGLNDDQHEWLATWIRSAVAHWLNLDLLHGNEQVVTLIGAQGCGKSTFCAQILPPQFRSYYLDHVNISNKFDKEMALSNNLIVNIDELDQIRPSQQAELKQMLSKIRVNGRPIFGRSQDDRRRFASFVATTNNPRPLHDPTGSRRYICIEIPQNSIICNDRSIDYDQLYAQIVYEVREQKLPYWFTPAETRRIEEHNIRYQHTNDLESMLNACFRRPESDEIVKPILTRDIVRILATSYPELNQTQGMTVKVGRILRAMNFAQKDLTQGSAYYLVPLKIAS